MSQNLIALPTTGTVDGLTMTTKTNQAIDTVASRWRGTGDPGAIGAGLPWVDTTKNLLKRRNAANSGWIVEATQDEAFVIARSGNTVLGESDRGKAILATSTFTQTLTAAATLGDGWSCYYKNNGTGVITLDPNSSETIDGATTLVLAPGDSCIIQCNGSAFYTIAKTTRDVPQVSKSAAYTTVLADAGCHILHPSADTTARTFTIDSNANVPYPIGTAITFVNQNAAGTLTISITSDTMRLAGAGTTGSRTLAANGIATALKVTSTEWIISGTNLT